MMSLCLLSSTSWLVILFFMLLDDYLLASRWHREIPRAAGLIGVDLLNRLAAVPEIARRAGFAAPLCASGRRPIRDCRPLAAPDRYFVK